MKTATNIHGLLVKHYAERTLEYGERVVVTQELTPNWHVLFLAIADTIADCQQP